MLFERVLVNFKHEPCNSSGTWGKICEGENLAHSLSKLSQMPHYRSPHESSSTTVQAHWIVWSLGGGFSGGQIYFIRISSHPNDSSQSRMPGYFCNIQPVDILNQILSPLLSGHKNMLASTQAGGEVWEIKACPLHSSFLFSAPPQQFLLENIILHH